MNIDIFKQKINHEFQTIVDESIGEEQRNVGAESNEDEDVHSRNIDDVFDFASTHDVNSENFNK